MAHVSFRLEQEPPRVVAVADGVETDVPALWLRERCQDEASLDPASRQRLFDPHNLPDDLIVTVARWDESGGLWLEFNDGYAGLYDLAALGADFDPSDGCPAPMPWDAGLSPLPRHAWPGLVEPDRALAAITDFLERGFVIIDRTPTEPRTILQVARRFGYVRETNFGELFEVYSRPRANDLAYTAVKLGPHTDNPYREPVPGIQLLHCLVNDAAGGESTMVDGVTVALALADEDPEGYELLATTPVRFRFADGDADLVERRPIIERHDGVLAGIHYSPRLDFLPLLPDQETRRFHRARRRLAELLADPAFEIRFSLRPGELVMFDNNRVLHGRAAFDPGSGYRHLQGCYIDRDGPRSLFRVLSRWRA